MECYVWHDLQSQDDIDLLQDTFGGFHDGCIREMRYIGNGYVDDSLSMGCTDGVRLRVLFQRQWKDPSVIEMEFICVNRLNVCVDYDYFPLIFDAALFFHENLIYWANDENWKLDDDPSSDIVWISAKKARWRIIDGSLGQALFYRSAHDDDPEDNEGTPVPLGGPHP